MAILKSVKSEAILDLLASLDISLREILTELLPADDADEFVLNLLPATLLNSMLTSLRQRLQLQANSS